MTLSGPGRARGTTLAIISLAAAITLPTAAEAVAGGAGTAAKAGARRHGTTHRGISTRRGGSQGVLGATVPRELMRASHRAHAADRQLVRRARSMRHCLESHRRAPIKCSRGRGAVQGAGRGYAAAERRLASLARSGSRRSSASGAHGARSRRNPRTAPTVAVAGRTLHWSHVAAVATYVLMRTVPGQAAQYELVHGQSATPPPVPGLTVDYRVRTAARSSTWSAVHKITYPTVGHGGEGHKPDPQAAPWITVSGTSLTWNQVAGVTTYVLRTRVTGQIDRYDEVTGTATTPAAQPGLTVHYSVRTAVEGSAWSPEVSIAYPATPVPTTPAPPAPSTGPGGLEVGSVVGSNAMYELPWLKTLGAHTARIEMPINSSVRELEPIVEAYAKAGIKPLLLAGFNARIPSTAEAQNLATWAAAFGPGGTFWKNRVVPAGTAVTDIEFGNETNNPWQYLGYTPSNWATEPAFLARAEEYARRLRDAQVAIATTGSPVGLLGIADQYSGFTTWVDAMFRAVPDLGSRVAGWTSHPYGTGWQKNLDTLISDTAAHGAPPLPIYATEIGLSTDNGRCLDDNFGFNKCMTYAEAATTLNSTIEAMRSRYGSRLHAIYIFQARDQSATGTSTSREVYFGALQSNMAPKGAFTEEVESLLASYP